LSKTSVLLLLAAFPILSLLLWLARREVTALLLQPVLHVLAAAHDVADRSTITARAQLGIYRTEAWQFKRYHGRTVATDIMLSAIVIGVVAAAGILNYHLVYVPMHNVAANLAIEQVDEKSVENMARWLAVFLVILEGFAGLLLFEFCGITKLFDYVTNLPRIARMILAGVMFAFLTVSAAVEVALAFDRTSVSLRKDESQNSAAENQREMDNQRTEDAAAGQGKHSKAANPPKIGSSSAAAIQASAAPEPAPGSWDWIAKYTEVPFAALIPFALAVVAIPLEIAFLVFPLIIRFGAVSVLVLSSALLRSFAWIVAISGICFLLAYRLATFPAYCAMRALGGGRTGIR
jgi:hypothetical protein